MPVYQIFPTDPQGRIADDAEPLFKARSQQDAVALLMVAEMYVTPHADILAFGRRVSYLHDCQLVRVKGQQFCPNCRDYVETEPWPYDMRLNGDGQSSCVHCGVWTDGPAPKRAVATVTEDHVEGVAIIEMINGDMYRVYPRGARRVVVEQVAIT